MRTVSYIHLPQRIPQKPLKIQVAWSNMSRFTNPSNSLSNRTSIQSMKAKQRRTITLHHLSLCRAISMTDVGGPAKHKLNTMCWAASLNLSSRQIGQHELYTLKVAWRLVSSWAVYQSCGQPSTSPPMMKSYASHICPCANHLLNNR